VEYLKSALNYKNPWELTNVKIAALPPVASPPIAPPVSGG